MVAMATRALIPKWKSNLISALSGARFMPLSFAAAVIASPPREWPISATRVRSTFLKNGVAGIVVPGAEGAQVLEQEVAARGVVAREAADAELGPRGGVEEVLVDGRDDEAARGELLAEVRVPHLGEVVHRVPAVGDEHDRERTVALGVPDVRVDRHRRGVEAPVLAPGPAFEAVPSLHEGRAVDGIGVISFAPSPYSGRRRSLPLP